MGSRGAFSSLCSQYCCANIPWGSGSKSIQIVKYYSGGKTLRFPMRSVFRPTPHPRTNPLKKETRETLRWLWTKMRQNQLILSGLSPCFLSNIMPLLHLDVKDIRALNLPLVLSRGSSSSPKGSLPRFLHVIRSVTIHSKAKSRLDLSSGPFFLVPLCVIFGDGSRAMSAVLGNTILDLSHHHHYHYWRTTHREQPRGRYQYWDAQSPSLRLQSSSSYSRSQRSRHPT